MSEWKEYKLKDLGRVVTGNTPSSKFPEEFGNEMPFVTPSDYKNYNKWISFADRNLSQKGIEKLQSRLLPKNSLLVTCIGSDMGKVAINKIPVISNQQINSIIPNENVDADFLYYKLVESYDVLRMYGEAGTAVPIVNKTDFENIEIEIPSEKSEQTAIAEVLSSLDDKIDLLHRQNATLEKMAETLFRQWFVEEAKEEWEEGTLDDILSVKGGTTPSTAEPSYWNGTIHWTTPKDITNLNGLFLFDTERKITELGLSRISSGLLPIGTLLMTSRAPVGVLAFAEIPLAINQGYIAIIANKGYSKEFIYLWLKTNIDVVHSFSNGSTFMEISKSTFKTLQLQIPPSDVLNNFQSIVAPLFTKIKSNSIQIRTLTALRDTLLPKLMSGEVRVEMN
ncbi:MAG: restriction endonuclease subunit S [Chitinophagaceae bacterium]